MQRLALTNGLSDSRPMATKGNITKDVQSSVEHQLSSARRTVPNPNGDPVTTRTKKAIICIVTILVICGIGFGGYIYWNVLKPWHEFQDEDQIVAEMFKRMESEPPPGVAKREWKEFLG